MKQLHLKQLFYNSLKYIYFAKLFFMVLLSDKGIV